MSAFPFPRDIPRVLGRAGCRGFTLIEMLVTLSVVAILMAIAVPRIDTVGFKADAAQRLVRGTLLKAQRMAIQRNYDVVVAFDTINDRIRMVEDVNLDRVIDSTADRVTWRHLEEGARFGVPAADLLGGAPARVTGPNLRAIEGYPSIIFRRNGAASTDAAVYVTVRRNVPKDFRAVRVTQATGRTEAFRWLGNAWQGSAP